MRLIKKILMGFGLLILLLVVVYLVGPTPKTPVYHEVIPEVPSELSQLETSIHTKEANLALKPDNEARIIWADSTNKKQTEYAVVYLHGFTASPQEGDPVHRNFAKTFGCNLYLARLAGHGLLDKDAMLDFTADHLWESGLEALAIGKKLGKKVILIGTSTGGTLALRLAATFPDIKALVLYSPNIAINDGTAWLANNPWGLQIARKMMGGNYSKKSTDTDPKALQYWYSQYRLEAVPQLEEFLETSNTPQMFAKIKQPVLMLYYYKNKEQQDATAKVDAMLKMFSELGTPSNLKKEVALPNAGTHVIASPIFSKDVPGVERETLNFATGILGMNPIKPLKPE